ncbi:cyclic nucleotide-binding domain-containing protein [Marinifilum sp. N1E240]|uniref:Crp/Fnr family transcriptional regulator n=1 Tax=Marinifilum sp. N1E240 TaxID=2608082 RepID=UPI00128C7032|nr:Crp/Fnr family transcriptional regulator [Marinifilum sp. N1E240]MPQ47730.1 cyclic nucleotide-binding domain-containing protein [Marinifilum sp. N1E240]
MRINSKIWDRLKEVATEQQLPAKFIILREGEVSNNIYFIKKGCLRLCFNNDGKDVTFQFFFEGDAVSSIESFWANQPSMFSLETIEASTILHVSKTDFHRIVTSSVEIKELVEKQIFQRLITYQKLFLSRIKEKPQERYEQLLTHNPDIFNRIPQHYIASYLGITSVSLSRIRNRK